MTEPAQTKSIVGWFDSPEQTVPAHDPGLAVNCPVCSKPLSPPMVTHSLLDSSEEGERECRDALADLIPLLESVTVEYGETRGRVWPSMELIIRRLDGLRRLVGEPASMEEAIVAAAKSIQDYRAEHPTEAGA